MTIYGHHLARIITKILFSQQHTKNLILLARFAGCQDFGLSESKGGEVMRSIPTVTDPGELADHCQHVGHPEGSTALT